MYSLRLGVGGWARLLYVVCNISVPVSPCLVEFDVARAPGFVPGFLCFSGHVKHHIDLSKGLKDLCFSGHVKSHIDFSQEIKETH